MITFNQSTKSYIIRNIYLKRKRYYNCKVKNNMRIWGGTTVLITKQPDSVIAEAYRGLKTNIQYSSIDEQYKVLVITSAIPGEGKTTVAANLALALAESEKRVLLIDCDFRKPSLYKQFIICNMSGISQILTNELKLQEVLVSYNDNLDIIPSGGKVPNPSEMLSSKAMDDFLNDMKECYDYIILDTPPMKAAADAQVLISRADAVLFVIKSNSTKKEDIKEAIDLIEKVQGKIIGTVLNQSKSTIENYYYYIDYGKKAKRRKRR